jgi:carboxyl-terminal processing protease
LIPSKEDGDLVRYRQVRDFVLSSYVRETDADDLLDRALQGLVETLDPYSKYYGRDEIAELNRMTTGTFKGIGVIFAPIRPPGQVLFAMPGSPAAEAGLKVGDRIVTAQGDPVAKMSAADLREVIAQSADVGLKLELLARDGSERAVRLDPEELVDPTIRHARHLGPSSKVGYLSISSFTRQTRSEFDDQVEALGGRELGALIVDVRGNLGGVLDAAVEIANRFIAGGLVVTHESRGESVVFEADPEEALYLGLPLAVLVDEDSASASEVFAAALQEHRAAVIVGSPTYGKGMVQQVREFGEHESVVKLTTSYYFTPSHRNIERTVDDAWESGLLPDLSVELTPAETQLIHRHLESYGAPTEVLAELRDWEREAGAPLVPVHPPDAQLDAALALFRGQRPGAWYARASAR